METTEQEVTEITEPIVANTIPAEVPIEDTEEFIQLVKNSVDEQYVIQWLFGKGFDWIGAYTVLKKCVVNHELFIQTYVDHLDEMLRCIPEMEQDANKMMEIYQSSGYENIIVRYIKDYKKVGDATAYTLYRLFVWKNGFYDKRGFNKLIKTVNTYTRKAKEIYPEIDENDWITEAILDNKDIKTICAYIDRYVLNKNSNLCIYSETYLDRYIKKYKLEYNYAATVDRMSEDNKKEQASNEKIFNVTMGIAMIPAAIILIPMYAAAGIFACIAIYILISGFFAMIS